MFIDEFCDSYAVAQRDRIASKKYFGFRGVTEATEDEWIAKFEAAKFNLGRAGKPQLKSLIVKNLDQLTELASAFPEDEWREFATNKAKLAKYLSNK
jgi:hypothetical protein